MLALLTLEDAHATEVWVVTDHGHPITAYTGARVIYLDAPTRIQSNLSAQLPSEPQQAAGVVRNRLQEGGMATHQQFAAAYQGVVTAWNFGIAKIPAVIVDRRFVVYGETDVTRALALIEHYRSTHP